MKEAKLDAPLDDDAAQTQTRDAFGASGGTIGPYRLLETLGEGGMGEVWLAEQTRPVRRQVALKIIKAGLDTAQVVARFQAERQALALMDHPAIAKVFDAGSTDQGRPYFAMEYVRGESLTSHCDRHRLSIRERLELFIQVCEGVQHAHQKGIIHRDLKPSNILVTVQDDRPVPKIIDFGVAKATSQPLTEHPLYTALAGFVGTPEYMSPEQAEMGGIDIDTRTDVYAVGVVLYELLTGVLPLEAKSFTDQGLDEIRRVVREVEPPKPSSRVTHLGGSSTNAAGARKTDPGHLVRMLRGDLDWIVLKALDKNRTRRYQTINALALDIKRYLADEPVSAGPPSTTYRVRKFARRHRFGVVTAATLLFLLLISSFTATFQAARIARERDRANREALAARRVADFLVGLFRISDPSEARGNSLTAREVLDKGAATLDQTLSDQPELQARLQVTIGKVYMNLGLYQPAEQLLQRAAETYQRHLGRDAAESMATQSTLADVHWYQGRVKVAESIYLEIMNRRQQLLGTDHPDTLRAAFDLASTYYGQGRLTDAEELTRNVLEAQKRVLGTEHPDTLASLNNLGALLQHQNRHDEAVAVNAETLKLRQRVFGPKHPDTLRSYSNVGSNYLRLGRLEEAASHLSVAAEQRREVLGEAHPATLWSVVLLARTYRQQKRFSEAERELLSVAKVLRVSSTTGGTVTAVNVEGLVFNLAEELAELYRTWGKPREAAEWQSRIPRPKDAAAGR